MKDRCIFFLKYYFPVLFWAGVIFFFSSVPNLQIAMYSTTEEIILRKGAHFVEFVILAFLLWRFFYIGHKFQVRHTFWWAFVLAASYAASDEFHQTFVFGRTGKVIDALYDTASALFVLEMLVVIVRRKLKWKNFAVLFLATLMLIGLEIKMISETKSFKVSFSQMKTDLGYMLKHEVDFVRDHFFLSPKNDAQKIEPSIEASIEASTNESISKPSPLSTTTTIATAISSTTPIAVPFTTQAPLGVWDAVHEEACEEASLVMLKYYQEGKTLTPKIAEDELQAMVKFETKKYGDYKDATAAEMVRLAADFYGMKNLRVVYDFSQNDLKEELSKGKPIIVPAAGRLLKNPFFTPPGPLYHNLVLTGYDGKKIITNDPGTKRGENYAYNLDVLYTAIHDFPGKAEDIEKGRKAMIVFE